MEHNTNIGKDDWDAARQATGKGGVAQWFCPGPCQTDDWEGAGSIPIGFLCKSEDEGDAAKRNQPRQTSNHDFVHMASKKLQLFALYI